MLTGAPASPAARISPDQFVRASRLCMGWIDFIIVTHIRLEFVEPSKRYANVIIPEGGYNRVALDLIVARIDSMLQE